MYVRTYVELARGRSSSRFVRTIDRLRDTFVRFFFFLFSLFFFYGERFRTLQRREVKITRFSRVIRTTLTYFVEYLRNNVRRQCLF